MTNGCFLRKKRRASRCKYQVAARRRKCRPLSSDGRSEKFQCQLGQESQRNDAGLRPAKGVVGESNSVTA